MYVEEERSFEAQRSDCPGSKACVGSKVAGPRAPRIYPRAVELVNPF